MMTLREQLLHLADLYSSAATPGRRGAVKFSSISSRVFDDGKTLPRVAAGGDVTTGSYERALRWFSDNWPESAAWPEGIARPAPSTEAA